LNLKWSKWRRTAEESDERREDKPFLLTLAKEKRMGKFLRVNTKKKLSGLRKHQKLTQV
jgi:hypothetical protein